MKLISVAKAYMELKKFSNESLPIKLSYQISKAIGKLSQPFHFYADKEEELLDKYKPDKQEGYNLHFNDAETWRKYTEAHNELDEIEEEIDIQPIEISVDSPVKISPDGIALLEELGIIRIVECEEGCTHGH